MSFEEQAELPQHAPAYTQSAADDNTMLALAGGIIAALAAGGIWAALVVFTGFEIGYVAWAVGLLVGWTMTRATRNRSVQLARAAAAFAVLGLLAGKIFIFLGSTGVIARSVEANEEVMRSTVAWWLYDQRELEAATLEELDATLAAGDTISDAAWQRMNDQAALRLATMTGPEREAIARLAARAGMRRVGLINGVLGQLSLFDVLWILLAVGTAYRMLLPHREQEPAELQTV